MKSPVRHAPRVKFTADPNDDWRNRAECVNEDPELFFPVGSTGPAAAQIEEARSVCRRCEAMEQCLRWALDTDQPDGVWGALTADERRALKRRRRRRERAEAEAAAVERIADHRRMAVASE